MTIDPDEVIIINATLISKELELAEWERVKKHVEKVGIMDSVRISGDHEYAYGVEVVIRGRHIIGTVIARDDGDDLRTECAQRFAYMFDF